MSIFDGHSAWREVLNGHHASYSGTLYPLQPHVLNSIVHFVGKTTHQQGVNLRDLLRIGQTFANNNEKAFYTQLVLMKLVSTLMYSL